MLVRPHWAPEGIDMHTPSAARMYDYYLGGNHNFEVDRTLAQRALTIWPDLPHIARANRAFLHRAVAYLSGLGVDQFLDLGSGIPTVGTVHEVATAANAAARTVYVDSDVVAVAHGRHLLANVPGAAMVEADLRDAAGVLHDPVVSSLLDLERPVAVLMAAMLHFIPDADDPAGVVEAYHKSTVPGSHIVVSHATDEYSPDQARQTEEVYRQAASPMTFRGRDEIAALLGDYELVPPGLVDMIAWHPDPRAGQTDPLGGDPRRYSGLAAVGTRY